ncbi:MAG: response regulator transcription factor [Blautia sp.]|nr:response regulator transcription factor [Blautia sp.]
MKKILMIEDEQEIAELVKDYLLVEGFSVDISNNGDKGCAKAILDNYDLFIVDVMLPGMDGFSVCKKIREYKNTPIIVLSAKKEDADKIKGLSLGADDYMTKPFSPGELVARVKAHLNTYQRLVGANQPQNLIKIRGLTINKMTKQVWVNGVEKHLPSKEYDMLILFAEHPGRVFSKQQLFASVWKMEPVGEVNTITVHINKLRELIEVVPSEPQYIETLWGVGYRFRA